MRFLKVILIALTALTVVACQRTMPVYNVEHQSFPMAVENLTNDKIRTAIIHAGGLRGWIISERTDGVLEAVITPRRHMAKVQITFDRKGFSIQYLDSNELLYNGVKIHRNYNTWVKNLQNDILREVTLAASMAS